MTDASAPASAGPSRAQPLVELVLRPARFFRDASLAAGVRARIALVLLMGLGSALERFGGDGSARLLTVPARDTWAYHWGWVLGMAVVLGPVRWLAGGWWLRLRLRWCGATGATGAEARLVSALTDAVMDVPMLVAAIGQWMVYDTPLRAAKAAEAPVRGGVATVFVVAWSLYLVHEAAVARFRADRRKARVWFGIVPGVLLFGLFAWGFVRGLR